MREPIFDWLQAYPFWLMDVAPVEALALPIFTPLSGFASITAPEVTVELQDIKECNWHFKRSTIKGADASQMTLTRGTTVYDSDFWRWIVASIVGDTEWQLKLPFIPPTRIGGPSPRRQLVLIHYFSRSPVGGSVGAAAAAIAAGLVGAEAALAGSASLGNAATLAGAAASSILGGGPIDFVARIPARAWILTGCLPVRYKVGSDFDAKSGEVSIAELDIKPELIEEISLTS
jgi:hypothetical protein